MSNLLSAIRRAGEKNNNNNNNKAIGEKKDTKHFDTNTTLGIKKRARNGIIINRINDTVEPTKENKNGIDEQRINGGRLPEALDVFKSLEGIN